MSRGDLIRSLAAAGWATLLSLSLGVNYTFAAMSSFGWELSIWLFAGCCAAGAGSISLLIELWRRQ